MNGEDSATEDHLNDRDDGVTPVVLLFMFLIAVLLAGRPVWSSEARGGKPAVPSCIGTLVHGKVVNKQRTPVGDLDFHVMKFVEETKDNRVDTVLTAEDPEGTTDAAGGFLFCLKKPDRYVVESYRAGMRAFLKSSGRGSVLIIDATQGLKALDIGEVVAPFDR